MGDQSKLVLLKEVVKTIREEGLLQRVRETGQVLLCGLENIQVITCQIQPKGKVYTETEHYKETDLFLSTNCFFLSFLRCIDKTAVSNYCPAFK